MSSQNFYSVLGIARTADSATIKRAYRELAMKWHPDKNPGKIAEAEVKFLAISEAYTTLSDPAKRTKYDSGLDAQERPSSPKSPFGASFPFGAAAGFGAGFPFGGAAFRGNPRAYEPDSDDFDDDFDDIEDMDDMDDDFFDLLGMGVPRGPRTPRKPIDPFSVHIVNLGAITSEFKIRDAFSKFGHVVSIHLMRDRRTRASEGKGFVRFATTEACRKCVSTRNIMIDGHCIGILQAYQRGA
jgi:DnaJ-class molecular chaperone